MSWKNWPYWLKGGLIGGIFGLFLWIISFLESIFGRNILEFLYPAGFNCQLYNHFYCGVRRMVAVIGSPLCFLSGMSEGAGWCWILLGHVLNVVLLFPIGALIGWIIGKIKQK